MAELALYTLVLKAEASALDDDSPRAALLAEARAGRLLRAAPMIALRLHDKGDLRLHEEPVPKPGDDEVLVRVTAVGLCGSDLHWFHEGAIGDVVLTRPLVLGHEFVGVIETGARTGERVALDPAIPCGGCAPCLAGDENLCIACRFAGNSIDGALRSRLAWPERLAHPLPDSLPDAEAIAARATRRRVARARPRSSASRA